jgi:hypothetical protein
LEPGCYLQLTLRLHEDPLAAVLPETPMAPYLHPKPVPMKTLSLRIATVAIALLLATAAGVLAQNASPSGQLTISTLPPPVLKDPFRGQPAASPLLPEPTLKNPFTRALDRLSEPVLKDPFKKTVDVEPADDRRRYRQLPEPNIKDPFRPR